MPSMPNILLILADDMGYGDFGVFGDGSPRTPTLDQLVGEGITFTQHYSSAPVCAPARATFLTGRYPHRTGAIDTLEGRGLDRLALQERTAGDFFKAAGYATGLIGKWHLGALDPRYHPNARGFDEFVGFRGGWSDYYRWRLDYNGSLHESDGRYLTDVFADEAVQFIRRHHQEPFFVHVAFNAPHFPFQAPPEVVRPFQDTGRFTSAVSTIYGMLWRMDQAIQRILEELDRWGIRENTIVLFTSDNGPQFGGEGENSTRRFNCRFHGHKGLVFEGGIRVPAVLRWPAQVPGSLQVSEMTHFSEWLPTLVDMAGLSVPRDHALDGNSIFPLVRGERDSVATQRFWQWNRYTPLVSCNAAMRDGPWKLVRPAISAAMKVSAEDLEVDRRLKYDPQSITDISREPEPVRDVPPPPPPLLFNLDVDPYEEQDLAEEEPERVRRMLRDLETWFNTVEAERRNIPE